MEEKIFIGFIHNILNIRISDVSSTDDSLEMFEAECCLEKSLQPMYTADSLRYLIENIEDETFYEITDFLDTNLLLFRFSKTVYLVGPYVKKTFSQAELSELLASHKLKANLFFSLKLYYSQFPQLSYSMVQATLLAAMRTFSPNTPEFSFRKLTGFHEELVYEQITSHTNKTYEQIEQQYELENFFLRKITEGDVSAVAIAFENISKAYYSNSANSQQNLYTTDWNGFSILRTLARKAAEQGGCPVIKIDEITRESIQAFTKSKSPSDMLRVEKTMLEKLTQAVAGSRQMAKYSPIIREVLNYLYLNYPHEISLVELSDRVHVSPEHLSRLFKKEVGESLTSYVSKLRTKKAADLLKTSALSVAEIAMYVGYPDNNYFVKVFKKHYGLTPSAYRKSIGLLQ